MFAKTLRRAWCGLWGMFLLTGAGSSLAEYPLNLTPGVTDISNTGL